jgi:cruciform cutting endonuclease 1
MALKIPASLKLDQLKFLATQCGISTSGTKGALTDRLIKEVVPTLHHAPRKAGPQRILSIDMGIRNLAYCVIDVPRQGGTLSAKENPSVLDWRRLSVLSTPEQMREDLPIAKEAFDPQTLSTAAYRLLKKTLLPHNPAHILIERQRFRSGGSSHVLEWTVRVNMLESMLYAVLETLKSEGLWKGNVVPILPGKVGPFWMERVEGVEYAKKSRKTKTAKLLSKGFKIDLVRNWLQCGQEFSLGNGDVESTAEAYLRKWSKGPGKGKRTTASDTAIKPAEEMGKLDDLADCLLQGMAWLEWESNKRKLLEEGIDSLQLK